MANRNQFKIFKTDIRNLLFELNEDFTEQTLGRYPVYTLYSHNGFKICYLIIKGGVVNIYSDYQGWIILPHRDQFSKAIKQTIKDYYYICMKKYKKHEDGQSE